MGHTEATYNLAIFYHYGYGTSADLAKAYDLYIESANDGYGKGMELVGRFYNQGIFVEQDRKQAEYWLQKAMESPDPDAVAEAQDAGLYSDGIVESGLCRYSFPGGIVRCTNPQKAEQMYHADVQEKPINRECYMEIREYKSYNEPEILRLYKSVGWTAYTDHPELLRKGFDNSMLSLAAYEEDQLLGIIRVVGDGHTIVFIQDILVFPEHQRKGIGTALLQAILDRYSHVRQIELATDNTPKTIAFYKSMGFREISEIGCCGFMKA